MWVGDGAVMLNSICIIIPSFSWGGASGFVDFNINKAFEVANRVMNRRELNLTNKDRDILKYIEIESQNLK